VVAVMVAFSCCSVIEIGIFVFSVVSVQAQNDDAIYFPFCRLMVGGCP
jgi:hypothetical protein